MGYQAASLMVLWMAQALFGVVTMDSGQTPNHSNHVCSTWGSYHFKTFDGDYYEFPGSCTYNFVSHCGGSYSDFSVHIHRSYDSNHPVIDKILITIKDVNIELRTSIAVVSGLIAVTPYYRDGIVITKSVAYFKVYTKTGFTLMWNKGDAVMVELDPIYNNYTCGLCGDYNGINDFSVEGRKLSPIQFGNLQNIYDPKETCTDLDETKAIIDTSSCSQYRLLCENRLGDAAFDNCRDFLNVEAYINACMLDMCSCGQSPTTICLCSTISEFSRQCSHAGGHPGNWRTDSFCPIECPNNMIYQESSSPCMNTCSNLDSNHVCLEHYIDDCFCPEGTVQDDYTEQGCVPVSECHCIYQERLYRPGEMITNDCNTCHCISGIWNCTDHACPGPCSIEGGAHITTFDGKSYTFHGNCYYVLSKEFENSSHVILGEITRISSLETILKSIMVFMDDRKNVVTFKTDGTVLLNDQRVTLPQVTATFSISQPTDSYIILNAAFGLQMQIQLQPVMQLYITMDESFIGKLQGLCGNFNYMEIDDFQISGGLVEATASAFANTWKTNAMCPDVSDWLDDPCSLSIENKKYADHWCSLLEGNKSPFAKCHSTINPAEYAKRCHYDSCSCKDSEKCMCAALSSYVRACAAKGIILWGWRKGVCDKYIDSCPSSQIYLYNLTTCQPTCHSLAEGEKACASGFTAVDGCGCPDGEFLNEKDQCVPISQCSCYNDGSYVNPLESITKQNEHCTCHDGKLVCSPFQANACSNEKVYYDCNNQTNAPNQRSCKTLAIGNFPTACISGCVCPNGLLDDGAGGCVPEEDCPCSYKEDIYRSGTTIDVDCNTCFCQSGSWDCTKNVCYRTCSIYGSGHYITFDEKLYDFDGKCEFVAATDYCGPNHSTGTFSIVTENVPCGTTGVTCSRAIKVFLGNKILKLADRKLEETASEGEKSVSYLTREVGLYLVIQTDNDILLIWDKKTTVFIKVSPTYKGNLCGLCGNFDGNSQNDFMAKNMLQVVNVLEFGNSWKSDSACPDATEVIKPCLTNPHRQAWAEKQCGLIKGDVFKICHSKVDPLPFYEACVSDACACDSGGDCECFCTAVAAYAQECTKAKACVNWRTPDICPIFCDYYNPKDECQWHYHPCGKHSMKTCRSINNVYTNVTITYLEGCYPTCPKDKPIYDEFNRICVRPERCGCFINNTRYDIGDPIPNYKICHNCNCTEGGVYCVVNDTSVSTTSPWTMTTPTSTGSGDCFVKKCVNGTEKMKHVICETSTPITTSVTSTTVTTTTVSTSTATTSPWTMTTITSTCVPKKECQWTEWFDVNKPSDGLDGGDYETYEEIRKRYTFCSVPKQIECRAVNAPDVSLEDLKQNVHCNVSNGLICKNSDQPSDSLWQKCFNYKIRVNCCDYDSYDCSTTTRTTTPTTTTETSTVTTTTPTTTTSPTTTMTATPTTTTETSTVTTTTPITTTSPTTTTTTATPTTTTETSTVTTTTPITTTSPTTTITATPTTTTETTPVTTTTPITTTSPTTTMTATPTTTTETTPVTTTTSITTTVPICKKCEWSRWFDVSSPTLEPNGGDFETYVNIRKAGYDVCEKPEQIACRSTRSPNSSLESNGQFVTCNVSSGLICRNNDQEGDLHLCFDYEISVYCCQEVDDCISTPITTTLSISPSTITETTTSTELPTTSEVTSPTTPFTSTTLTTTPSTTTLTQSTTTTFSTTTPSCTPVCSWSPWFDVSYPNSNPDGGDFETYTNIRKAGFQVCEKPQDISCRSKDRPDTALKMLGQNVTCDVSYGLECYKNHPVFPCLNFEIKVFCCQLPSHCLVPTTSTTPFTSTTLTTTPSTTTVTESTTSTELTTTSEVTTPTTPFTSTTLTTTPSTTTVTETTTSTELPTTSEVTSPTTPFTSTTLTTTPSTTTVTESTTSTELTTTSEVTSPTTPFTSTTPSTTTLTQSTTTTFSTTTPSCTPVCSWSPWFDVSYPNSNPDGEDFETYTNIRKAGFQVCEKPQDISCRSKDRPDTALTELGQNVTCDVSYGLECYKNHPVFPCLNFEIKVFCCQLPSHCPVHTTSTTPFTSTTLTTMPSTTTVTETTTSTEYPTTSEVTTSTSPFTSTTLTTTPSTTTVTETTTSTELPTTSEVTTSTTPFTSTTLTTTPSTTTVTETTTSTEYPTTSEVTTSTSPFTSTTLTTTPSTTTVTETTTSTEYPTTSEVTTSTSPFTSTTLTTTPSTTTVTETTTSTELPTTSEVTTSTTPFTSTTLTTTPSTTTVTETTTSTEYPTTSEVTTSTSPFTSTTLTTTPSTTTVTETTTSTELPTTSEVTTSTTPFTSTTLTTTPSTTTVTETTTSTEYPTTSEVTTSTTPFTSTTLTTTPSTTTVTETTTSTELTTTSEVTTSTTPYTSTTLTTTPSTTTVTQSTTTAFSTTTPSCTPVCSWSPWFDVSYSNSNPDGGDFETYTNIRKAGFQVCEKPQDISCRSKDNPDITLEELGQNVTCDVSYGLECYKNHPVFPCLNFEIKVLCCQLPSHCPVPTTSTTPFTSTTLTTMPSTTTVTESTTSTELPTTSEVTSPTTPFTSTTLTTTPSTTTETQSTTTTFSTTKEHVIIITPTTTARTPEHQKGPTTTSTTVTFVNTTTTESTTTSATPCVCYYNGVTYPEGDIKSGAFGKLCYRIVCSETCTVTSQSWDCESPTTTTPTSTTSTPTASTTTTTATSHSTTTIVTSPETNSTTTQSTHSTVSSSTVLPPPPDCLLVPPRKYNETWKIDNCTVAKCLGGTSVNITSTKCKPQPPITCVNGFPPISVTDDDQCCQHWECQCPCFGWGDPHFYTFDGTLYDFQGTCTYTLVEEIIKKISTFGVYIDNYDCGAKDRVSCPRDIIVKYENQTIRLQKTFGLQPTVQVIVNGAVVGTPYTNNGVKVYASGINYVVEIPSIQSFIKYDGFRFEINLPYHRFGNNTQGHCGTCTNNRSDDCLTKSGNYFSKCEDMAPSWIYNYTNNPNCVIGTTTVSPIVSSTHSTTTTTCTPSTTCEIIKDTIFQECHKFYPPEPYYRTCIFDSCHASNMECSSLEQYAQLCAGQGICIPWRNNASKCRLTCPSDKVYKACVPVKQRTCQTTPEQYAVMQNNTRLIEGCFCPEGTMRHSDAVDKCVSDCGCVGPDNVPRRFGENFQLGCLDCVCREGGSGLYCDKHKCSMNKNVICEQAGFIPVTRIDSNDPCCNETVCICDINQCPSKPSCRIGYEAVGVIANGSCCTLYNCVSKKVCVHENAEYMPGTKVFLDKCKNCVCSYSDSGAEILCTDVPCNKQCPLGYELMNSTSDCCGDCIQTHCVINDKDGLSLLQPGESRKSKYDSCKVYNCTLIKGQFSTSVSQTPCPYFNEDNCVPGTIELSPNGCCKQCIETSPSCKLNQKLEYLSHNDCQSEHLVNITYCEGPCNTLSIYSLAASKMSHTCTCCQEVKTTERTVTMRCSNGRREELSYVKVEECNCVSNDCESSQLQKTFTTGRAQRFTRDRK
ncbi:mucin-5B-like isoform X3 [Lithobates pipiens]